MVRVKMHVIKSAEADVWKGTNVCLVPQSNWDCMVLLQQHARYKAENPQTSALVLVPEQARKECSPLLANMTCLGKHMLPCHERKWIYRDDPSAKLGIQLAADLPNTVRVLRVGEPCGAPELTFVFSAMVAGLKCTCLWDSGAATSFIAQQFVQRHGLKVGSHTRQIVLADGSQTSTLGCFDAKLQMEKHSNNMRFHVTKLVDGFDIILGNDWSLQQQVEAKFGGASPTDSHLYLRKTQTRVYALNNSRRLLPRAHEVEQALLPEVLSAVQVERILKQGPKRGCLEPFLVMVRQKANSADEGTSPQTLRSDRLKALLDKYSTVFKEPRFGASANTVLPCIELEPGSTPPNRPAFRLPMSQRQEVESGWQNS
jgi:hypothetical protein